MSHETIDNLAAQYAAERLYYGVGNASHYGVPAFPEPYSLAECLWAVVERPISPEEVVGLVSEMTGVEPRTIRSGSRVRREARSRDLVAWLLVRRLGYSINEAGAFLNVPHSVAHRGTRRCEASLASGGVPAPPA